jgi:hypothetical protein
MRSIWNDADLQGIRQRVRRLKPDAVPGWGRFSAPQMVCHVTDGLKMAMGELAVPPRKMAIRYFPLKQLIIYVLPFPKGAPTAKELLQRQATVWGDEISEFQRTLDRFVAARGREVWPDHPAFGSMSRRTIGVLVYRHLDHHFRQFGC